MNEDLRDLLDDFDVTPKSLCKVRSVESLKELEPLTEVPTLRISKQKKSKLERKIKKV